MVGLPEEIAVVEDDEGMRHALERLLRLAGFRTAAFASAEALLESPAAATACCFVLDIHLPGMSGAELREHLVRAGTKCPVVFITALDEPAARKAAERAGAGYLAKPFPGDMLIGAVTRALQSAKSGTP